MHGGVWRWYKWESVYRLQTICSGLIPGWKHILYLIYTSRETPNSICNLRNTDWSKFRSELGDKLNYCNGFRVESKDGLEVMVVMLDTSIRDSFTSSYPNKTIQDKSMWWSNELNKLRKNTRRKLRLAKRQSGLEHWESYCEAQCWYRHAVRQAKGDSWMRVYDMKIRFQN